MVLRKPYAFLLKNFKKINIALLALVAFIYYNTNKLHGFLNNYVNTGIYSTKLNNINNYVNTTTILAFLAVIFISSVLIFLLKRKNKPIVSYVLVLVVNIAALVFFLFSKNFFTYKATKSFNLVSAKLLGDISFILVFPYYILLFLLTIRSIGLDLKNFGFQDDKEFLEIAEEDREEVEVQVGFDKHKWIRRVKYYFRNTKYFVLEHKYQLLLIGAIFTLLGIKQFYNYYFVENKVYKMNQTVFSNYYGINVHNTYLTNKGYSGQIVANDGEYFVLVDVDITNKLGNDRTFDIQKMLLYIDHSYYVPTTKYNEYFKDMGNLYKKIAIKGNETNSYLLVYKVPKPDNKANFVLKYQDLMSKNGKLIQIKIKLVDISEYKNKGTGTYPNQFVVPLNKEESVEFKIKEYEITSDVEYTYKICRSDGSCPITSGEYTAKPSEKILFMKYSNVDLTKDKFLNFLKSYAKVKYEINNEEKTANIKYVTNKAYKGDYVYLIVPSEIENATTISLVFTVRSYQYTYRLKGE